MRPERDRRCDAAFTLIEVAVSTAILGTVVAGLLLVESRAQRTYALAKEIMTSTRLCSSRAAALRAGLAGEGEGEFFRPAGYTWRIARKEPPAEAGDRLEAFEVRVMPPSGREEAAASVTVWLTSYQEPQPR